MYGHKKRFSLYFSGYNLMEQASDTRHSLYTAKDFDSGIEVRWCPGCGDYSILKQVQTVLAQIGVANENIVFVSGIGCSGRFPYYMNTYGLHTIHGRGITVAEGIKMINPDLEVWVVMGDGDGFSIGLNHTLQALRRNFNLRVLFFNNQIYGLTKGQYSPTSEMDKKTSSSPLGSIDRPFNPLALVLAAGATFIARAMDRDAKNLREILLQAAQHKGTAFVEIYQNCNIFNDKAFDIFLDKQGRSSIFLKENKVAYLGPNEEQALYTDGSVLKIGEAKEIDPAQLFTHDPADLRKAFCLIHELFQSELPRPFGVLYASWDKATYEERMAAQVKTLPDRKGALARLFKGRDFWEVA